MHSSTTNPDFFQPNRRTTTSQLTGELQGVLRARLKLVAWVLVVPCIIIEAVFAFAHVRRALTDSLPNLLIIFLLLQTLAFVGSRRPLSLRQLRAVEAVLFASAAFSLAWGQLRWYWSGWLIGVAVPGQENKVMQLAGDSISFPWFLLIVLYGVSIPNTGGRSARVVALLGLIPIALTVYLGWQDVLLGPELLNGALIKVVFWVAVAAAIAIYGSHKLQTLQQQAFAARKLGQYQLVKRLGQGGMGEVYLARHQLLRRPCAIKLIRPGQSADAATLDRFEREVQAMCTLHNWNTVEVFDYGHTDDGTFYYVMEYLPGLSLDQLVEQFGPLPPVRAVMLLLQVCASLREAHAAGLIHRDIKPGNIIVSELGGVADVVKLLDFGLVQSVALEGDGRLTTPGSIVGTPLYMSPEQAAGDVNLDVRADVYSVGAVAYFLLTGQPVFVRDSAMRVLAAQISEPVVPLGEIRSGIPPDVQDIVHRCLEKDRGRRFPDVAGLAAALTACECAGQWTETQAAAWWREHGPVKAEQESAQRA